MDTFDTSVLPLRIPLATVTNIKRSTVARSKASKLCTPSKTMASGRCLAVDKSNVRNRQITCDCPGGIYNVPLSHIGADVECLDCGHTVSQHEDYDINTRPGPLTLLPQSMAFLVTVFCCLAVAYIYNRVVGDSRTGFPMNGAPGVSLDETFCPRTTTIEKLLQIITHARVVYVRGTPACGKSTMATLLRRYVLDSHRHLKVHSFTWTQTYLPWFEYMNIQSGLAYLKADDWASMENTLIIIDEVQVSFHDTGLWSDLIKPMSERPLKAGPMIVLFGSYGSPLTGPRRGTTPMTFAPDQRVSLQPNFQSTPSLTLQQGSSILTPKIGLFFDHTEYKDVLVRFQRSSSIGGQPFILSKELSERIWDLTSGHPGGVRALLTILMEATESRSYRKDREQVPLHAVLPVLTDLPRLFQALSYTSFNRSLPSEDVIKSNPALAAFLREMLSFDACEGDISSNEQLNFCHQEGWVHAEALTKKNLVWGSTYETLTFVFPSKLHRRKLEFLLLSTDFPYQKFQSVEELSFTALRDFRKVCLRSDEVKLSSGGLKKPVESQYRDEFYRSCFEVLGRKIFLISEFSTPGCEGRIDFFIKSTKWGIECVREGDRLQQHIQRFLPGGSYYPLIERGEMDQHLLIDFRTSTPPTLEGTAITPFFLYS